MSRREGSAGAIDGATAKPSGPAWFVPSPSERPSMVPWYGPGQLARTAIDVVISTTFGNHADRRVLDSLATKDDPVVVCDYSAEEELWIDYVADTGDGWDSTYSIAYHLAQPTLAVLDHGGGPLTEPLQRGRVLVFGGDQVYPTPSRDRYERRLVAPYRTALAYTGKPHPTAFAIPGNHDWYDSLVAFTRLFCGKRWIGGWCTQQRRSYFVVKLPHHWWLVGTDVQLDSDIDEPQLAHFRKAAEKLDEGDRIILCTAEPHWIAEARYQRFDPTVTERNLDFLEQRVFRRRIAVFIAGDLHHYRRHEDAEGNQKITAGGGGAFLHPTHPDERETATLSGGYTCRAAFPEPEGSRRLAWRNLLFPIINPTFGLATAVLYFMLAWAVHAEAGAAGPTGVADGVRLVGQGLVRSQTTAFWLALLLAGFYFFTDTKSPRYRLVAGPLHGLVHGLGAFFVALGATVLTSRWFDLGTAAQLASAGVLILLGGYVVGAMIMGAYLLISVNVFRRHAGEAFSSLRCKDYKSWVRFQVNRAGDLVIYPIGLRRVARRWKYRPAPRPDATDHSALVPDDPRASRPTLIERPVVVRGPVAAPVGVPAPGAVSQGSAPARGGA